MSSDSRSVIDHLESAWRAISARDMDAAVAHYADDVHMFDAKPPFAMRGVERAVRENWEACGPYLPPFEVEAREVEVTAAGDLAFATYFLRLKVEEEGHPASATWIRGTSCLRRIDGAWKIVHEHASVPFDPMTGQIVPVPEPGAAE